MEKQITLSRETLPAMPLAEWRASLIYWQLMSQILGKIRMELHPKMNHWWHVTLTVTPRGTSTGTIPYRNSNFDLELDLIDHKLVLRTGSGQILALPLEGRPIAEFYSHVFDMLESVGIHAQILAEPYKCCDTTQPFPTDRIHSTYDKDAVHRAWTILRSVDPVFKEFRSRFIGKCSPVQQFWHSFDLACTRFSGRRVPDLEIPDHVAQEAYSHECISAGFWFGDDNFPEPAFYCYTWPAPAGLDQQQLMPEAAFWRDYHGAPQATLRYEDLRQMDNPHAALLDFLQSSYEAGANLAGWNRTELECEP